MVVFPVFYLNYNFTIDQLVVVLHIVIVHAVTKFIVDSTHALNLISVI